MPHAPTSTWHGSATTPSPTPCHAFTQPASPATQDAVFYQLPTHPQFYEEILNQVQESEAGGLPTITVLFSALDALRLERVVGRQRAARMLKPSSNSTFLFC